MEVLTTSVIKSLAQEAREQWPVLDMTRPHVLIGNLLFVYHLIKASENLLKVAAQNSEGPLRAYFEAHLEEERQHEKWLANDFKSIGIDVSTSIVPIEAVQAAGSQYYLIQHVDAAALLGYMLVLECFPMSLDLVQKLEGVHGADILRTLRYHALHDIDHGDGVLGAIDMLNDEQRLLVSQNAIQTAFYIGSALRKIAQ